MTTWVPPCVPNLWGHPSLECPSCSRAMHATHPWNVTLSGRISSSGSLLVLRVTASSTAHAWAPRDLGFSLTDNWWVVWDPPLMAQLCCSNHRCPTSLHCWGHISTSWWSTSDHSSTPWLTCPSKHWHALLVGPSLRGLIITSGQRRPRTGRYRFWNKYVLAVWIKLQPSLAKNTFFRSKNSFKIGMAFGKLVHGF